MLHAKNTVKLLTKSALVVGFAMVCLAKHGFAQDSSEDDFSETSKSPSVFEKVFGSSSKKAANSTPKPKVPASPASTNGKRGGFLLPLKSFTKVFRGSSEAEVTEELEVEPAESAAQTRIPREPFRNLPIIQDRRNRAINDIVIEKSDRILGAQISDGPEIADQNSSKPAPIIQTEPTTPTKPLVGPKSSKSAAKPSSIKAKQELQSSRSATALTLESNSTSRRTSMDSSGQGLQSEPAYIEPGLSSVSSEERNARSMEARPLPNSKPSNLLELGKPDSETSSKAPSQTIITRLPSEASPVKPNTGKNSNAVPTLGSDDLPKINRTNVVSSEIKPRESDRNNSTKPALPANSLALSQDMSVPGVRVLVNGPSALLINQEESYEVVATNEGKVPLNGLAVRVAVPAQVQIGQVFASAGVAQPDNDQDGNAIVWELDNLPAGASKSIRLMLQTAKPEHFALGIEWTLMPQTADMQIQVQQPQLAVAIEGPSEVEFGKPQMYRVRVKNPGNSEAKAVSITLSAEPYGSNQSDIGNVAAGAERVIEVEMTFQQPGLLPVVASASSATSKLQANSAIEVQVKQSELVATWHGPTEFYQGSVAEYDLELTNTGSIAAINTICSVKLPQGAETTTLPPGAVRTGELVKWEVKRVEAQQKVTFPFRLTLTKLGENSLSLNAICSSSVDATAEIVTSVDSMADLHLAVIDPVAPAPVGQPVTYEIVITNRGKKAANSVDVVAQFSEGVEPIRVEGHTGRIVPGQAIFNSIGSIKPNEKLTLKVVAEASKSGVHRFRAEVKCVGGDADLLEEESTRYLASGAQTQRR